MSQPRNRAGGVPAFAGLRSFFPGARSAETDPPKDPDEDEEARKARRAEEDKTRDEEDARRAEEDDRRKEEDARRAEEDDKDPKDPDSKTKGKKADEDDDETCEDGDDDKETAAAKRAGRLAERARWTSALNDPAVAPHAAAACVLLSTSDLHSSAVIGAVKALGPGPARGGRRSLDDRMQVEAPANPGADARAPKPGSASAQAAAIVQAGKKRRGEVQ